MGAQVHKDSKQGESWLGVGIRKLCLVAMESGWRGEAGGRESHEAVVTVLQVGKKGDLD